VITNYPTLVQTVFNRLIPLSRDLWPMISSECIV